MNLVRWANDLCQSSTVSLSNSYYRSELTMWQVPFTLFELLMVVLCSALPVLVRYVEVSVCLLYVHCYFHWMHCFHEVWTSEDASSGTSTLRLIVSHWLPISAFMRCWFSIVRFLHCANDISCFLLLAAVLSLLRLIFLVSLQVMHDYLLLMFGISCWYPFVGV